MQRTTKAPRPSIVGYCMGATLSAIWAALRIVKFAPWSSQWN